MICRYCGQWNPDEAMRCSFCTNAKDALEDSTAEVRRSQAHAEIVPERPKDGPLPSVRAQGEPEFSRALRLADHIWAIVGGIISVLVGLLYLLGRCS